MTLIKNSAEIFALLSFCGSCHEISNFQIKLTAILSMLFGHRYNFEIYAAEAFITYQEFDKYSKLKGFFCNSNNIKAMKEKLCVQYVETRLYKIFHSTQEDCIQSLINTRSHNLPQYSVVQNSTNPSSLSFDTGHNHSHVNQVYNTHSLHSIVANFRFPTAFTLN